MIVEHLLVENGGDTPRNGRDYPDPVGRAAPAQTLLILHVFQEGLGRRVVVRDGHVVFLWLIKADFNPGDQNVDSLKTGGQCAQDFTLGGANHNSRPYRLAG